MLFAVNTQPSGTWGGKENFNHLGIFAAVEDVREFAEEISPHHFSHGGQVDAGQPFSVVLEYPPRGSGEPLLEGLRGSGAIDYLNYLDTNRADPQVLNHLLCLTYLIDDGRRRKFVFVPAYGPNVPKTEPVTVRFTTYDYRTGQDTPQQVSFFAPRGALSLLQKALEEAAAGSQSPFGPASRPLLGVGQSLGKLLPLENRGTYLSAEPTLGAVVALYAGATSAPALPNVGTQFPFASSIPLDPLGVIRPPLGHRRAVATERRELGERYQATGQMAGTEQIRRRAQNLEDILDPETTPLNANQFRHLLSECASHETELTAYTKDLLFRTARELGVRVTKAMTKAALCQLLSRHLAVLNLVPSSLPKVLGIL